MSFAKLKRRLEIGVARDDLADDYGDFINQAIRQICLDRSWQAMKKRPTLTLTAGQTSLSLPADFKELAAPRNSPIWMVTSDNRRLPVEVLQRSEMLRGGSLNDTYQLRTYVDDTTSPKSLVFATASTSDIPLEVEYYGFLSDLEEDDDTNALVDDFFEMVAEKAKAIAFAAINDPEGASREAAFLLHFRRACATDSYRQIAGSRMRM